MNERELRRLIEQKEGERVEFKKAQSNFNFDDLAKYCVALANERGGHLVLGVTDKPPRQITGTTVIGNPGKQSQKLFEAIRFRVRITEVEVEGKRVVVCEVPSRPLGVALQHKGTFYMRNGESLVGMSFDEVQRIAAETSNTLHDSVARCSESEVLELLDANALYRPRGLPVPAPGHVCSDFVDLRLLSPDGSHFEVTTMGALLFAKSLKRFDLERKGPRVVSFSGADNTSLEAEHEAAKGYAVGFEGLVDYVRQRSTKISFKGAIRTEKSPYPDAALREIVANALVHQDFDAIGRVMIEVFDDRICVKSPGAPIVAPDRFIDKQKSRNETFAKVMRRLGICEEVGSGIVKVVRAAESKRLQAPDFIDDGDATIVVLQGPTKYSDMAHFDRLRACYQHACVMWLGRKYMTNGSLRFRLGLPNSETKKVSTLIGAAVERGFIKQYNDSRRFAKYYPYWGQ